MPASGGQAVPTPTTAGRAPATVAPARLWRSSDLTITANPSSAAGAEWTLLRTPTGGSAGATLLSNRRDNIDDYATVWCVASPCPNRAAGNFENLPMIGVSTNRQLLAHPDNDEDAVLRWKSPFTGTVNMSAEVRMLYAPSGGVTWALRSDGGVLASGEAGPVGSGTSKRTTVSVGQTIELAIGPRGDRSGDTTVIVLEISEVK